MGFPVMQILVVVALVIAAGAVWYGLGGRSCARYRKDGLLLLAVAALVFAPTLVAHVRAQDPPPGFPDLVGALRATPGCLGVETARTMSGKQVIFAWFEDKKAALTWYYSDTHQAVMKQFFPQRPQHAPMADVADAGGPILAIASLTMIDKPQGTVTSLPVSQIAIELYRPVPGGVALGGRFAPGGLKVPGLREIPLADARPSAK